jgi:hypothetical protein
MRVQDHRDQHDAVAEKDGDHRLPPVHTRLDKPAGERVRRNYDTHPDPQCRNVPRRPSALFYCRGRKVAVPQRAGGHIFTQFFEFVLGNGDI